MRENISANGVFGENLAVKLLESKGFEILERNFHSRFGEIDIIARDAEYLIFAEVKTRSIGASLGAPREAVDKAKQQKIIRTALHYLQNSNLPLQPRFDVIEVYLTPGAKHKIKHIQNAFEVGEHR